MRARARFGWMTTLCLATLCAAQAQQAEPFAAKEVLVRFVDDLSSSDIGNVNSEYGLQPIQVFPHLGLHHYRVLGDSSIEAIVEALTKDERIRFAEPNFVNDIEGVVPDPLFARQWSLHNAGQAVNGRIGMSDVDIDWPEAVDLYRYNADVTVAVLDSGVGLDHPELVSRIWINDGERVNGQLVNNGLDDGSNGYVDDLFGWDFVDSDNLPLDEHGHGTQISSVIAGAAYNDEGGTGVAPLSLIMPLRVADDFGSAPTTSIINAATYAAQKGAKIINLSLGSTTYSASMAAQLEWLDSQGVLVVAAAGNGGSDGLGDDNDFEPVYPASYAGENVISVAAIDPFANLAEFSNYGAASVDLAAPGVNIHGADIARETVHFEDFEAGAVGWTQGHLAGSSQVYDWSLEARLGKTYASDSVDAVLGSVPYAEGTRSYFQSPLIDLQGTFSPQLTINFWYDVELLYDWFYIQASIEDQTWETVGLPVTGTLGPFGVLERQTFDLSTYEGHTISVRGLLESDSSINSDGVYIDDFEITRVTLFEYDGTQFAFSDGTSFAAPMVSGVAALLMSHRPDLTHRRIRELIIDSAHFYPTLTDRVASAGALNARSALAAAIAEPATDTDQDGVPDYSDDFPIDAGESNDTDGDGVGDNTDAFPTDSSETTDTDDDGIGDNADTDDDGDGVMDDDDDYPLGRFGDALPGHWAFVFVEALARAGVTSGCGNGNYCPEELVTRAQMAVFLERGMNGSDYSPPAATGTVFLDVGSDDFAGSFIEQLYSDGVTGGCGGNKYCPLDVVTRAQMAVFLLRAKHGAGNLPPPPNGTFGDVDLSYWAVSWIEQLAAEGITSGCGGGDYCPEQPVTRAQMAVFLVRTFGL